MDAKELMDLIQMGESSKVQFKVRVTNANSASNNIKAPIYIYTETVKIKEQNVVVAHIAEGTSKPHMDNNGTIWVKNGSDKRKVVAKEELARLLQSSGNLYADETIVTGTTVNDLDEAFFQKFILAKTKKSIEEFGQSTSSILANLGMIKEGSISLGALLLFGKHPQQYRPTFTVQCISFVGNEISSNKYRDKEDPFTGNLKQLYDKTLSFITRN